jgi:hypothetical protein
MSGEASTPESELDDEIRGSFTGVGSLQDWDFWNTTMVRDRKSATKRHSDKVKDGKAVEKGSDSAGKKRRDPSVPSELSQAEDSVLKIFRQFLMIPGQMLCFDRADLASFRAALDRLTKDGLLVEEKFHGGYSLTNAGFAAMHKQR